MKKATPQSDPSITELVNKLYKDEPSTLDDALLAAQIASLPKEEW